MGAAASSHILKLGNLRSVKAGEVLVTQGQSSPRLHYVMSGELTIACQDPSDASKQIKLGTRGKGEVIGEISFLLNTPPTASVLVAADYGQEVTVCVLERKAALAALQNNPKMAGGVFESLAVLMAQRIASSGSDVVLFANDLPDEATAHGRDEGDEISPEMFGLDDSGARLLLHAKVTVSVQDRRPRGAVSRAERRNHAAHDRNHAHGRRHQLQAPVMDDTARTSRALAPDSDHTLKYSGLAAVFSSALCLEMSALNFTSHRVVPFGDIYAVDSVDDPEWPCTMQLACKGYTLWLTTRTDDPVFGSLLQVCHGAPPRSPRSGPSSSGQATEAVCWSSRGSSRRFILLIGDMLPPSCRANDRKVELGVKLGAEGGGECMDALIALSSMLRCSPREPPQRECPPRG